MAFLFLGPLGVLGAAPAAAFVESRTPSSDPPLGHLGDRWLCAAADQRLHKESNKFQTPLSLNRAVWSGILS